MMVSPGNGINVYNSLQSVSAKNLSTTVQTEKKDAERNFDQVTISSRDSADKSNMSEIKSKIYNELQTATTTGTLSAIRQQIQSGEYKIDSTEIARRMLLQRGV
ncbi:MAG: flagellar biosynthesis anti-sigma factor FlgM [Clostridia bacterium]|nr:flagellar biosynthesis anti-sigma factor FlgM [Clostridia bacterium]